MGDKYKFVGHADPSSRIDRVELEDGSVLTLGGDPVELTNEQAQKLSGYISLVKVEEPAPDVNVNDSSSTQPTPSTSSSVSSAPQTEKGKVS